MLRVFALAVVGIVLSWSLLLAGLDSPSKISPQGCRMSFMWPSYILQTGLDGTWSKLASRYNLWLYREADLEPEAEVRGVLFDSTLELLISEFRSCTACQCCSSLEMLAHRDRFAQLPHLLLDNTTRRDLSCLRISKRRASSPWISLPVRAFQLTNLGRFECIGPKSISMRIYQPSTVLLCRLSEATQSPQLTTYCHNTPQTRKLLLWAIPWAESSGPRSCPPKTYRQ